MDMTLVRRRRPHLTIPGVAVPVSFVVAVAVVAGGIAVAEVIGGTFLVAASVWLALVLTPRAAEETDPGKVLKLDLFLVLVVVLGLSGVAVIGLAIL